MKNIRAIIQLFIANSISGFAQGISLIAIPWYFTDILEDTTLWGGIYAAVTFVSLFWGLYAGTLVDRMNRKHLFLGENLVGAVILLSISGLGFYLEAVPTPFVAMVFATTFFIFNLHYPALYAFLQEISDPKDYSRVTSYIEIQGQLTTVASGAIGAILLAGIQSGPTSFLGYQFDFPFSIEKWSLQKVFLLDGLSYVLSFLCILPISYRAVAKRYSEKTSLRKRFQVGIEYLKANPLIFIFGNAAYFVFVTTMVTNYDLVPNFVRNYLHAEANVFAISEVLFAIGAVFAGLFISSIFKTKDTVKGIIFMTLLAASAFLLMSFSTSLGVFYLVSLLWGLANAGDRIMRVTYLFSRIPNQVIGRTSSVFQVINVILRLFFILLFSLPFFIGKLPMAFLVFSVCCTIAALILIKYYKKLVA